MTIEAITLDQLNPPKANPRISVTPRQDHAAYIDNWLQVLKADKKAIFTAASKAAQASDYLAGFQDRAHTEAAA